MPIYEYECDCCRHRFEKKQRFYDEAIATCPQCEGKAHRVLSPIPTIFKGSGFYVTDSRKSTEKSESKEKSKETAKTEPPASIEKKPSTEKKSGS